MGTRRNPLIRAEYRQGDRTEGNGAPEGTLTTIAKDPKLLTFINVFVVEQANQQRLVDLLTRRDLAPLPYLQEALTLAKFEPGTYEVVETFAPSAAVD